MLPTGESGVGLFEFGDRAAVAAAPPAAARSAPVANEWPRPATKPVAAAPWRNLRRVRVEFLVTSDAESGAVLFSE